MQKTQLPQLLGMVIDIDGIINRLVLEFDFFVGIVQLFPTGFMEKTRHLGILPFDINNENPNLMTDKEHLFKNFACEKRTLLRN